MKSAWHAILHAISFRIWFRLALIVFTVNYAGTLVRQGTVSDWTAFFGVVGSVVVVQVLMTAVRWDGSLIHGLLLGAIPGCGYLAAVGFHGPPESSQHLHRVIAYFSLGILYWRTSKMILTAQRAGALRSSSQRQHRETISDQEVEERTD